MSLFARAAVARSAMRSLAATRVAQVAIRVVAAPLRSRSLLSKRFSSTGPSLARSDTFPKRHLGSNEAEQQEMLRALGYNSMSELIDAVVPKGIRLGRSLNIRQVPSESEYLAELRKVASQNKVFKSFIGQGYHNTIVPNVILRNVIENPAWYTPYTPYQAEIAQGRLQSLLNYQTMVADLTGMPVSNASLLDEATAAAEAMAVAFNAHRGKRTKFFVADGVHPQSLALIRTRAEPFGIEVVTGSPDALDYSAGDVCGALLQYPGTDGLVDPHIERHIAACKDAGAYCVVASDPLALTVLRPPGELGADMCVGTTQRFGVPLGFGGPHAGFFACADKLKRSIPGRIIGVSRDAQGRPALRMALQAREQHIRRDKATSNICTAQALLANVSAFYAMYHGPHGLRDIAERVHGLSTMFADGARALGLTVPHETFFDTVRVQVSAAAAVAVAAEAREMNVRVLASDAICVSMDETTAAADVAALLEVLAETHGAAAAPPLGAPRAAHDTFGALARESEFLTHPVFNSYQTETDMMRYMYELQTRDYGLANGMIPLGSCTMKLNAATEMIPVTWPEFNSIHPFAPASQTQGYTRMIRELESDLCEITGFDAVSLQPNSGANGEYAGLMAIRAYHKSRGDTRRNVCLIPLSAHGTNPASAAMAGMKVAPVKCDDDGNVDLDDLRARAAEHKDALAALMITYPSTHGVFEETIQSVCDIVHENGGQVYLDGANMNAQVGLCRPGDFGADVCHLNLHKTFCIPHGGGGPGVGPIGVKSQLAPFLPSHPVVPCGTDETTAIGPVAAAPFGSASILPISYGYIRMMGADGLRAASELAILNANYMAKRLHGYFDVMFTGTTGHVAHEFILDLSPFKKLADVTEFDIAKRLQDYGFHAPTMSWPVRSTVMAEPTESESKAELDRFCDALIAIRGEIDAIARGDLDREDNPLRNAPHTLEDVTATEWTHAYPRELAAFPIPSLRARKHWPTVGRLDDVFGDRNVVCTCPPMESYGEGFEARDAATI